MNDTVITIVAIFLAAILMFIFPLMTIADRNDDITEQSLITSTAEFGNTISLTGKITKEAYDAYVLKISSNSGNAYEVEIECQILDENPAKKVTQVETTKIGENVYFTRYTSQNEELLEQNGEINLKEGDIVTIRVRNTNKTISQLFKKVFYGSESDYSANETSFSTVVKANGQG